MSEKAEKKEKGVTKETAKADKKADVVPNETPEITKKEQQLWLTRKIAALNAKNGAKYTRAALRIQAANKEVLTNVM